MSPASLIEKARDHSNPNSVASRFRQKRWSRFLAEFPDLATMHVLDVGGRVATWANSSVQPASLTITNLTDAESLDGWSGEVPPHVTVRTWDATGDPEPMEAVGPFDLVYSNSVIEHVGGGEQRRAFARNIRRLGRAHWVQTPNRHFPLEPHWLFPFFQFLPLPVAASISRHWPFGYIRSPAHPRSVAVADVRGVELLTSTDLASLFPDAFLAREQVAGLTKSIIAVRAGSSDTEAP